MWGNLLREQYSHTFRKIRIDAPHPSLLGTGYFGIKMNNLRSRVYACIGSSGNNGSDGLACNLTECAFQYRLDSG